jgi:hypothetical protein
MKHLDFGWWLYFITCIGAWYGFFLFTWWSWKLKGRSTAVYQYVRFLLLGIAIMNAGSIYVRWWLSVDIEFYNKLVRHVLWKHRLWITLIFVWAIVLHMSYRAFYQRRKLLQENNELGHSMPYVPSECMDILEQRFAALEQGQEDILRNLGKRKEMLKNMLDTF